MPLTSLFPSLLSLFFFLHFIFLLVTAAVVFYESGGIFFTWVSVEKGGQSIKFELLKTIATSSSAVVSICALSVPWKGQHFSAYMTECIVISRVSDKYPWLLLGDSVVCLAYQDQPPHVEIELILQEDSLF